MQITKKVTRLETHLLWEANLPEMCLVLYCLSYFTDEEKSVYHGFAEPWLLLIINEMGL